MKKFNWYSYLRLGESQKKSFIGVILDKNNQAICFEKGEERKYKNALRKKETE